MTVFDAPNAATFAIAHVSTPAPPMRSRTARQIPPSLDAIVTQLLEKDPAKRIPSAKELLRRLQDLRDVPVWPRERAELWWATNMPGMAHNSQAHSEETETLESFCA